MINAVIDIGTNSVRLYIAEENGESQKKLLKDLATTRLGEGIASSRVLLPSAMERTLDAVEAFVNRAKTYGPQNIYIYATAAVRQAQNRDEFAKMLQIRTAIPLRVLSGEEEAEIAYLGAALGEDSAVIDIGGGSTEVIVANLAVKAVNLNIGAVYLKESYPTQDGAIAPQLQQEISAQLSREMAVFEPLGLQNAKTLIGVSGTVTTLASIALNQTSYNPDEVDGYRLDLETVDSLTGAVCGATLLQRKTMPGVPPERADILPYGALILRTFMQKFGYSSIITRDHDSLEGFLKWISKGDRK